MTLTQQSALFCFVQIIIFWSYPVIIMHTIGVQPSFSDSWYKLDSIPKKSLFTLWLWAVAATMIWVFICLDHWLFFASAAGLIFCGAAAPFRSAITREIHYAGASIGMGCALIGVIHRWDDGWIAAVMFIIHVTVIIFVVRKDKLWWFEWGTSLIVLLGIPHIMMDYSESIIVIETQSKLV